MRELAARLLLVATATSVVGLCAVVALVGVVGVVAQLAGTWTWLFRFEQSAAASVPLVLGLAAVSLVGAVGTVVLTPVDPE